MLFDTKIVIDGLDALEAIEAAIIDAARAASAEHKIDIEVILRNDRYFISRPFTLDAKAHPSLAYTNIKIRANEGSHPVIDSLTEIDASDFVRVSDGIYKYQFKKDETGKYPVFRQLCCNGKRLPLAKGDIFIHPFGLPNCQNYADPVNEKCLYLEYGEVKKILDYGDITSAELTMFLECTLAASTLTTCACRAAKNTFAQRLQARSIRASFSVNTAASTSPTANSSSPTTPHC